MRIYRFFNALNVGKTLKIVFARRLERALQKSARSDAFVYFGGRQMGRENRLL